MDQLELGDTGEDQVEMPYNVDASFKRQSPEQTFNTQIALEGGRNGMEYNSEASSSPRETLMTQGDSDTSDHGEGECSDSFVICIFVTPSQCVILVPH